MQIIEFIETTNWIVSQYSKETKMILFGGRFWRYRAEAREGNKLDDLVIKVLSISQDLAIARERIIAHPSAPQILTAFGLKELLEEDTALSIAKLAVTFQPTKAEDTRLRDEGTALLINRLADAWEGLVKCVNPIQALMVPKEVRDEKPFDETLTIELDYGENYPQARTISSVLDNTTKLYEVFAIASGHPNFPPLVIIYAASGTGFRFDLKGLGDPIKQLKGIFVDAWRLIRHRKADDFQTNGKAIIDGLNILERIESSRRKSALTMEEANRLKLHINRAMLHLLEAGAMPREVPDIEAVQNKELMQGIQQRLLPPAPEEEKQHGSSKKPSKKKKSTKTNRRKKQSAASSNEPNTQ